MDVDGFDWDEGNLRKIRKHGIEPHTIENLIQGKVWIGHDLKHSQCEERFMAIGKSENRFILVIFTIRIGGGKKLIRPISARSMHRKEIANYEEEIAEVENR